MTVRFAQAEDTDRIVAMAARFISSSSYQHQVAFNEAHLRGLIPWLMEQQLLLVLETSRGVVGMLAMATVPSLLSGELVASEVCWFVEPDVRGTSGAVRLWLRAEEWAREKGAKWIQMIAPAMATDVHDFYRRRGYMPLETVWQTRIYSE
jgi:GNAT superfamily N-acetyltransferase